MRNPKIEELNEDLKIDALKTAIMQTISDFQMSPSLIVYILKDILESTEVTKAQYLNESANKLREKLSQEKETEENSSDSIETE